MKLNLGCGFDKRKGYVNIDRRKECNPDMLIDLEKEGLKRFQDNSVEEIIMRDFLEHLSWRKIRWFLKEVYRVLKPNGLVHIQAPNFEAIVQKGINRSEDWKRWGLSSDWEKLSYWIMGSQEYPENTHKTIFTISGLKKLLERIGFKVERIESDGGTNLLCWCRK